MSKPKSPRAMSALSNGARLHIVPIDGRTKEGRRFADLVATLEAERGGAAAMDTGQRQAVRMFAQLAVERETIEADRASGKPIDAELYGRLCDRADRQIRRMGPVKAATRQTLEQRLAARKG